MVEPTHLCPIDWCDRQDDDHAEPFEPSEMGRVFYGVEPGTLVSTHSRDVATPEIGGQRLGISIEQNEMIRDGVSEFGPLTVAYYGGDGSDPMTADEARTLAAGLVAAADELSVMAGGEQQ